MELVNFINFAPLYTQVFKKGKDGVLYDLIDDTLIPDSRNMKDVDLVAYYTEKYESKKDFPTTTDIRDKYANTARDLVIQSKRETDSGNIIYINPLNHETEQDTEDAYIKNFTENLQKIINVNLAHTVSLPTLPNTTEWQNIMRHIRDEREQKKSTTSNVTESGESTSEPTGGTPPNATLPISQPPTITTNSPFVMSSRKKSNELRKMSVSTDVNLEKSFYIVNFRIFVLILRRLSNMVLIKRGLLDEVTYLTHIVTQENNSFSINQPFYKDQSKDDMQLSHKQILKLMNYRKYQLRPKPYDKKV